EQGVRASRSHLRQLFQQRRGEVETTAERRRLEGLDSRVAKHVVRTALPSRGSGRFTLPNGLSQVERLHGEPVPCAQQQRRANHASASASLVSASSGSESTRERPSRSAASAFAAATPWTCASGAASVACAAARSSSPTSS